MKIANNCKCFFSCELGLKRNDNLTGMIGTYFVDYVIRHGTRLCPIKQHQTTSMLRRLRKE